jgi:hypothetical protein
MAKKPKNKNATATRTPLEVNLNDITPTQDKPVVGAVSTEQAYGRVQPLREPVSDVLDTPHAETLVDDHQELSERKLTIDPEGSELFDAVAQQGTMVVDDAGQPLNNAEMVKTPFVTDAAKTLVAEKVELGAPRANLGDSLRNRLMQSTPKMDEAPKTDLTQGGIPGYVPDFDYVGGSQVGNILKQLEETAQGSNFDGDVLKDAVNEVVFYGERQLGEILDSETGLHAGTMVSVAYDTAMWKREDLEAKVLDLIVDTSLVDVYHRSPSLSRTEFVELRNNAKLLRRVALVFVGYSTFAFCQRPAHFPLDSEVDCALVVRHGTIQCTKLRSALDYNKDLVAF